MDDAFAPVDMADLLSQSRADLRLFSFPDGQAGLFLERDGTAYALTDVTGLAPVPLPAGLGLLAAALGTLAAVRRRAGGRARPLDAVRPET